MHASQTEPRAFGQVPSHYALRVTTRPTQISAIRRPPPPPLSGPPPRQRPAACSRNPSATASRDSPLRHAHQGPGYEPQDLWRSGLRLRLQSVGPVGSC